MHLKYPARLLDVVGKEIELMQKISISDNAAAEVRQAAGVHKVMDSCMDVASKYPDMKRMAKKSMIDLDSLPVRDAATMLNRASYLVKKVRANSKALSMIANMTKIYQNNDHRKMNEAVVNRMNPEKPLMLASEVSYLTVLPVKMMKNDLKLANLYLRTAGQRISAIKNVAR